MAEQDDITRDPTTGRVTVKKVGTYRISYPLVNLPSTGAAFSFVQPEANVSQQEQMQERAAYKAALTTIANEEGPEGVKPKYVAAFVLWGAHCYWCKGFRHPEAWTVGCQCAAAEPREGWGGDG